jgi:riboflavin synthase
MFTGIIEGLGTLKAIQMSGGGRGRRLTIEADFELDRTKIGDSIAVNGACLTAVTISGKRFEVDVAPETLKMTTFGEAKVGDRVNLERALRLSDRLDGHLVSGHIDGTGTIKQKRNVGNAIIVTIEVPERLSDYMIPKGSVAVDGISLTINQCRRDSFDLSIIPHTAHLTTIGFKEAGVRVNIETDMIGKYVRRFLTRQSDAGAETENEQSSAINKEFLAKAGFL